MRPGLVVSLASMALALAAPRPAGAQCTTVGASCSDGQFCTTGTTCNSSLVCTGGSTRSCSDGDPCTRDVCNETADRCDHPPASAGTSCDDGRFCTDPDRCDGAGTCTGSTRSCSDGDPCTEDQCDEGANRCEHPPAASGTSCSDGEFCTDNDTCDGSGGCVGGPPRDCSDGRDCTTDTCDESANSCDNVLASGCLIRGNCVDEGEAESDDPCSQCVPSIRTNQFSQAPAGASCGSPSCSGGSLTPPPTCDGSGACNPSSPMACSTGACLDGRQCAECTMDDQCPMGEFCVDFACRGSLMPGQGCDRTRQCAAGFCIDGVCCTTACDGPCVGCNLEGTVGLCTAHPAGTDPDTDCSGATCTGLGNCEGVDGGPVVVGEGGVILPTDGGPVSFDGAPPGATNLEAHGSGLLCSAGGRSGDRGATWLAIALLLLAARIGRRA